MAAICGAIGLLEHRIGMTLCELMEPQVRLVTMD